MSTSSDTSGQTSATSSTYSSKRRTIASPTDQRRAAKRRQAVGSRLRSFEAALPVIGTRRGARSRAATSAPNPSTTTRTSTTRTSTARATPRAKTARAASFGLAATAAQLGYTGFHWSKIFSLAALAAAVFALYWMQSDAGWYILPQQTTIAGYRLVSPNAIYEMAGIDGWNSVWLDRNQVRERLLVNPWVTDAKVTLDAPAVVTLQVTESPVVAAWVTDMGTYWVSPDGAALPFDGEIPPTMPRLIDPQQEAAVAGSTPGTAVDTQVVGSALALISQMSGLLQVRYSEAFGLNFALPGTTLWVYWGDGGQTEAKLEAIAIGKQYVATGKLDTQILDVRIPERPFVK